MPRRPPAEQTAFGPMLIVAVEQRYPLAQRLVHDALAVRFLPASARLIVGACCWRAMRELFVTLSETQAPGVWGGVLCRKRCADDRVAEAIADGITQVVILGAGLDTRAYRLVAPTGASAFEVDLPANIAYRRRRLQPISGRVPERLALLPVDLETDDLASVLASRGFRIGRPALFVAEAVSQYLTPDGARKTFAFLAQATTGSRLILSYVRQDFLNGTHLYGAGKLYRDFVVKQRLWRFRIEPQHVADLLRDYGWAEREQVGRAEYVHRYLEPAGRALSISDIERFVYTARP